ncbi:MAG TPA: TonB-dependent receptor, partial [Bryobacteraceae bacterium]
VSPWAKSPVAVSLGGEYRQEQANFEPDDNLGTGNDLGFGAVPPVHGRYNVSEGFGEIRVPVIEGMRFAELLQFEGAYRYSSYNLAGAVSTYKYSGEWAPTDDLRFRASFERAVRAPNINELFSAQGVSALPGKDPCSDLNGSALGYTTTRALCEATGVPGNAVFTGGLECPAGQCTAGIGGNPNLKPEVSDTRSIGVVLTPTFLDGFNATIDYYNIKVDGFIKAQQVQFVLNQCYDPHTNPNQDPNNPFCQLVHRNTAGEIFGEPVPPGGEVLTLSGNVARYQVKGWDLSANYQAQFSDWGMDPAWGGLAVNFVGTYQPLSRSQANAATAAINCAGLFGSVCPNGSPTPKWKHNFRVSWISPDNDITLSLLWRHISQESFDVMKFSGKASGTPCGYNTCDLAGDDDHIPSFDWFDVSGTWDIGHGIQLRGGVTNILNKRPPLVDINLSNSLVDSGNTFPATYDPVGRFFFGGVTVKL